MKKCIALLVLFLLTYPVAIAKDQPGTTLVWPEQGSPVLRFTFGKYKEVGSVGNQKSFMLDTTAENLWNKKISQAGFYLYLFDKNHVRIAQAWLTVSDIAAGQAVKFETTFAAPGTPASMELVSSYLPPELGPPAEPRKISITVNSVPQGASLKVDGHDVGPTPKVVQVAAGKHMLEFSKDGYNPGHFPLEVAPNDASGGSVSYELGNSAHDTIELRDGTVISGDLESATAVDVVVRVGGALQKFDRNKVKRISLVERDTLAQ